MNKNFRIQAARAVVFAGAATLLTTAHMATAEMYGEQGKSMEKTSDSMSESGASATSEMTVVEIAQDDEQFSTLVQAIEAAGLAETLSGDGPFTVLAPTNDAFDKLPDGTLDTLLRPENKQTLADILTYHVVPDAVMAEDVMADDMTEAPTVNGAALPVEVRSDKVMFGTPPSQATVTKADIEASNGVIHVIDKVIMPKS